MDVLQVLFQVFVMLAGVWFTFAASRHSEDAERSAESLRHMRAKLISLDAAFESLEAQHKKLNGRFYALRQELDFEGADAESEASTMERRREGSWNALRGGPLPLDAQTVCEQWAIAQRDGPHSPAARCECAYCTERRAHRERQRNALVPKTVQGQAEMAKLNAGKP